MYQFAVNLSTIFTEVPFLEKELLIMPSPTPFVWTLRPWDQIQKEVPYWNQEVNGIVNTKID